MPKAPEAALRQAFIDKGKAIGLEFMEVERETPLSEVGALTFALGRSEHVRDVVCIHFSWCQWVLPILWLSLMRARNCLYASEEDSLCSLAGLIVHENKV